MEFDLEGILLAVGDLGGVYQNFDFDEVNSAVVTDIKYSRDGTLRSISQM